MYVIKTIRPQQLSGAGARTTHLSGLYGSFAVLQCDVLLRAKLNRALGVDGGRTRSRGCVVMARFFRGGRNHWLSPDMNCFRPFKCSLYQSLTKLNVRLSLAHH